MQQMNVTVIIPVYNESGTICDVIAAVQGTGVPTEILAVDDGSTDGSRDLLVQLDGQGGVRVILHAHNQGKGAAVRTGIQNARGDVLIIQDADLEYDPQEYSRLLQPIAAGQTDVVYGSRFLGRQRRQFLFWSMLGNRLLTFATNVLYFTRLTDMETCYKVFRRSVVQDITLHARRFDFEPEFTAKLLKRRIRILEVPITYNPRDYTAGKKIRLKDAFQALWTLIKYRFVE